MRRTAALLAILAITGCKSTKTQAAPVDAGASSPPTPTPVGPAAAHFSRPIAAAHSASDVTYVAGLVVPRGVIAVTALGPDGATRWTRDVMDGVTWSANATLSVIATKAVGALVLFRGTRGGQEVSVARAIGAGGDPSGEAFTVGAAACGIEGELAWIERGTSGTWLVKSQSMGSTTPVVALTMSEDRDPALFCGASRGYALGDGEDDVTLASWASGVHSSPLRVIVNSDFRDDDERGHELYAVGDTLGLVRVGSAGNIASREMSGDHLTAWRHVGRRLQEADDLVLVDADARVAVLAFTHDASSAGDVTGATSVEAVAWERRGARDVSYQLAPVDPTRSRGPFWSGAVRGGVAVAWVERSTRGGGGDAPIVGMSYRVVNIDAVGESHRIERAADELVDAGCDDLRCYAVALARGVGEDGGQPETVQVLTYP